MKRRVLSFIIALALCLNLCPVGGFSADVGTEDGLCPHHPVHTEECGYASPVLEQECTHTHDDGCYTTEAVCVHIHTAECYPDAEDPEGTGPVLCAHTCTEDSGCVTKTLSCLHEHSDACGYIPGNPGAPCTFVCRVCPIEDLIAKLPDSVSVYNREQVQVQLTEIFDLYEALSEDEQLQVDLLPCVSLWEQLDGAGAEVLATSGAVTETIDTDKNDAPKKEVTSDIIISIVNGKTYTVKSANAVVVTSTGTLEITGEGTIISQKGVGVEVQAGGSLCVTGSGITIKGMTNALNIASGSNVQLSTGTFVSATAPTAAIYTADGDYAALLADGCAYFDANNMPVSPADVATLSRVTVKQCTDHLDRTYTHIPGTLTHSWTCSYCGTTGSEACTFTFDTEGNGTCDHCKNELTIAFDPNDLAELVYSGTIEPKDVGITFTLSNGTALTLEGEKDYTAKYNIHKDAGKVAVEVTGVTFGGTFTKTYTVSRPPVLTWDATKPTPIAVDYDGYPVEATDLPPVIIDIVGADSLQGYLEYSHRIAGANDPTYTDGLPTNAGTYDVIVSLPTVENFEGAVSAPIELIINKISPLLTLPAATKPVFNRSPQALVTAGTLCDVAVRDGIKILFAESETGPYSETIPTGINAGNYAVWYKVEGTENYIAVEPTEVSGVEILRKLITPVVELSYYTCVFDNGDKEPTVTVKDEDNVTVLLNTEYQVEYQNNRNAGTAKVIVTDKPGGNYSITQAEATFEITAQVQAGLNITGQPDTVTYGDIFTLGTSGGSGNGDVTWEITSGHDVAEVGNHSGQVTIKGHGTATVKATKSGSATTARIAGNYEDAVAYWTIEAEKKPVVATVTAEDKDYDGNAGATVHAVVEEGVLAGDEITITGLTGTFEDENAGVDKVVTVVTTGAVISGNNSQHYDVSYSSTTAKATIRKAVVEITTEPVPANLTYNGTEQELIATGAGVNTTGVVVEYALSEEGPYSTDFPKGTNAGTYTVWYRIQETNNYTGKVAQSIPVTIDKKSVTPAITLSEGSFVYDGTPKEPVVTLTEADGTTTIPANEYTVTYSNNINVGTATVTVTAKEDGNYSFTSAPVIKTFTIAQKKAEVLVAPGAVEPLIYNTKEQRLVSGGTASGGTMVYLVDGESGDYKGTIPAKKDAGTYTVHYKVQGDANHSDSDVGSVTVTIDPKVVNNPTIELTLTDQDGKPLVNYTYDGTAREPEVVVKDGSTVIEENEYNVIYRDNTDAGKATVEITDAQNDNYVVTGSTTFVIQKADIKFSKEPTAAVLTYTGMAQELLEPCEFSGGTIQYALNSSTSGYSDAIPTGTEAGTYTVYYRVEGDKNHNDVLPMLVENVAIKKATTTISVEPAEITSLTYNRQPQALVTPGKSNVGFLVYSLDGNNFFPEIPTGTDAGTYTVYYKIDETTNYDGVDVNETPISVTIAPKSITPKVELSESSYTYDGKKKNPIITVKDGSTVIEAEQYTVSWANSDTSITDGVLTAAGTYTATIANVTDGNYVFNTTATVEIIAAAQNALKITNKRDHVYYGDTFTLDTSGGSENGRVEWSVDPEDSSTTIDPNTGELTVKATGKFTVTAVRKVPNYGDVNDSWTFTVEPKRVVAAVTVEEKVYDGNAKVTDDDIKASVKPSDLVSGDSLLLTGLTGTYDNANVGTGKTVTLDDTKATKAVDGKYVVTYPATATGDITPKGVEVTVTLSDHDLKTETTDGTTTYYYEYDGTEKKPSVTVKVNADGGATLATSDYTVDYSNNKNFGTATVTVKNAAGGNYTFDDVTVNFTIRQAGAVLTSSPKANDLTYEKGTEQELVSVGVATGGTVVYALLKAGMTEPSDTDYSADIPTGENAGTYTVYYKVNGDANHADTVPGQVTVIIKPREFTPVIELNPTSYVYDGNEREPTVTVKDGTEVIANTEYTVSYRDNIHAGTATVIVSDANGGNYIVNGTASFTITPKAPTFTTLPTVINGLQYNGERQELVTAGVCNEGTVYYSVNDGEYSIAIPTASEVGSYKIMYKVEGDANHSNVAPVSLGPVEIARNTVTDPTISLSSDTFKYNGSQQKPTITVYDNHSRIIPESEYTVTITGTNGNVGMVDADTYTITIAAAANSNYVFQGDCTTTFEIVAADQEIISITGTKAQVFYGDVLPLGTSGGISGGTVEWKITGTGAISSTIGETTGLLTVKDVGGPIKVTVTSSRDNYAPVSATWEFTAAKKPVTAVVTAADRDYADNDKTVTVTATVPEGKLVSGDSITISGLTGTFDDANVGTDKKVTVNSSSPTVIGTNADKYDITYPATTTASIRAVSAKVVTAPSNVTPSLTYDASQAQALVTAGTATGGMMVYSLDGTNYVQTIPKAKDAGTYTVYYKAQGDRNHTDSGYGTVDVTIARRTVAPQIELSPPSAPYDGTVKHPEVTVRDAANNVIPTSEYKATYVADNGENWKDKGTYKVKIENINGGNYIIDTATEDFTISATAQAPLEIVNKPGLVYYGDTFTLSTSGGSSSVAVAWSSSDENIAHVDANGLVTIKGTGSATITATKAGGTNYDTATATYPLNALKKSITAIVTADDRVYASGVTTATIDVTWKPGDLVGTDEINTMGIAGAFTDDSVGTGKTVTITGTPVSDAISQKYDITIPPTTTASILKAVAETPSVTAVLDLEYTGKAQDLVAGGDAKTLYSSTKDGVYSAAVPQKTNAGTYTVWYKAPGDANHTDSEPQSCTVTISPKTLTADTTNTTLSGNDLQTADDGTYYYAYDGTDKTPTVTITYGSAVVPAREYTVSYSDNKNVTTADTKATVTITDNEGGNYTVSGNVTFEIRKSSAQLTSSPQARTLTYTGQPQELVTVGTATGGHIKYSLDGTTYGSDIPTGTNAGTYTVQYKVVGDDNHKDGETGSVSVTISPKTVISPKITVSGTYTYDGNAKVPAGTDVTVEDGATTIPASEYVLSYRDNVNAGTAMVIVTNANSSNYIVNGTGTFEIAKIAPNVVAPKGKTGLQYNGELQELVEAGSTSDGTLVYSLAEKGEYTPAIPTGKDVGEYEIWYKVLGDQNHEDSTAASVTASIIVNSVSNPTIQVTPPKVTYTGEKQEPTVTVKDDQGLVIDGSEYRVAYAHDEGGDADLIRVGKYTLTITGTGANYSFNATAEFEILPADQTPLTITGTREQVYYGDTIQLGTTGGNGTIEWEVDDAIASIDNNGLLKITGSGASVTVTATSKATGYEDQTTAWSFYAEKKPVTAVVTAAAKTYDGNATATVTATVQSSDLVDGDKISITLPGSSFEDPNAGTDKKVNVDSTNPIFSDDSTGQGNYNITYPATTTASILKAEIAAADVTAPTAETGLEYTGLPLTLVTAGSVKDNTGTMEYSVDNITYSATLPTGTNVGDYEISYRVKGDGNHKDREAATLTDKATIVQQKVTNPTIELTPTGAIYDGKEHKPTVTVKDKNGRVIPDSEYAVSYETGDWTKAGTYTVTVTDKDTGGNYTISGATEDFFITHMDQSPLSIMNQPGLVQYGDRAFTLTAVGGSGTGPVTWNSDKADIASIDQNGLVKVLKAGGPVTIKATKATDGGYSEVSATWTFSVEKKPVSPIVTAKDKVYDGNGTAQLVIRWQSGDLVAGDTIDLKGVLTGRFDSADVGTDKEVTITGTVPAYDNYDIKVPTSTTASITPKAASVSGTTPDTLTYTGSEQALVSGLTATNGTLAYSRNGSYYTLSVPKETNAGTYTVWYKAQATDENHKDSSPVMVEVTISPRTVNNPVIELSSDTFDYDGTAKKPDVVVKDNSTVIPASEYTVGYSNNTAIGNATVTISNAPGGNYIVNGSETFTIKAGAPAIVSAPEPRELTYNGRLQTLVTRGSAVNGHMEYSFDEYDDYSTSLPKETNAGVYEVWYKVVGDDGIETEPDFVEVEISPKPVTPTILLDGQYSYSTPYTGSAITPTVTVIVDGQGLTPGTYSSRYNKNKDVGTAEVIVQSTSGNYQFFTIATFEITKGKATFYAAPEPVDGLVYTGEPQVLVTNGIAEHPDDGVVLYSVNGAPYASSLPTGTQKGRYIVSAKVQGNSMYEDSDVVRCTVDIGINKVNSPTVELSQSSFPYTGSVQKPTITVSDDDGNVISSSEYQVTYTGDTINPGKYTLTITSREKNYSFADIAREITILPAGQTPLTITGKKDTVYYGDVLSLGATGGADDGVVTWTATGPVDRLGNGQYKVTSSGSVTITATKGEATDTWTFYAQPKPVTAVVTAENKTYDNNNTAKLTVTVSSGLVGSDTFIVTAQGHFADANAGTNKTVFITGLTIPDGVKEKYEIISYNPTTTASITPKPAVVIDADKPTLANGPLIYDGSPHPLLANGGTAEGGYMMYSLDGRDYTYSIPTGTDAGSYTVWYKVVANNDNYKDSTPVNLGTVTISANNDTPSVLCMPATFQYDGTVKTPEVVVRDRAQRIIPESEYTVTLPDNRIAVGTYTVTVTDKSGGNYHFSGDVTGTFEIVAASQNPLSIITDKPTDVYYGETFRLSAMGGSGSGAIVWNIKDGNGVAEISTSGVVTVKGIGGFTVEAYREADGGYSKSNTDSVPFFANPKPVTPVVTAEDKPYDGKMDVKLNASWPNGALEAGDTITFKVEGQFATADVGTNKRVNITIHEALGDATTVAKYAITWPETTTASISKVDAKLNTLPVATNPVYTGDPQALVAPGSTVGNIGTIVYCLNNQNGTYSESIPTATNIGEYTVWYKVADSVNYTGIPAASVKAEIKAASSDTPSMEIPSTFPDSMFMSPGNTPGAVGAPSADPTGAPIQATVQDGTASTVVSSADGEQLVKEAVESQSRNIVIKPEISGDVTKAQVSIPASTVNQIKSETDASLTVSAPMADVTIPQAALDTLGSTGGTIDVVTERVDRALVLTLTADGEKVENVPGGVTLTVPAEDAGPGTVAVLVHADGTRETIRKSVAGDGKVSIPLSGSAAVEIVDNSKTFADVPPTSWAADAAAFVSARELFGGTGETTFSPDEPMSRGMLATVLYRLEGSPSQDAASGFSDVSGDAWYADGIAWAAENGIADGYGNGQFGPDESVTREQFAVMLWKYAGSPETDDQSLAFTDADQASDYARKALLWAVRNGIMSGDGRGQLAPGETATRAEAAQMLKNFMENT